MRVTALSIFMAGIMLLSSLSLLGTGSVLADPEETGFDQPSWSFGDQYVGESDAHLPQSSPGVLAGNYTPHEGFDIYDNDEFMEHVTNESWPGSGTLEDPYIIQGYEFTLVDETSGIRIRDVSYHFDIRDCYMHTDDPFVYFDVAVYLINVHGVNVENVITRNSKTAIAIEDCSDITISGSDIGHLGDAPGILLENTDSVLISDTKVVGGVMGTYMEGCVDVHVSGCNYTDSEFPALWIDGGDLFTIENVTAWETALVLPYYRDEIDMLEFRGENTVNGLPLLVMKDVDLGGETITSGYGQYLLFNVTNGHLSGVRAPFSNYQMVLADCSDLILEDINLMASKIPMVFNSCTDCEMRGLEVSAGNLGVGYYIFDSEDCSFLNSSASFFAFGIRAEGISDILISGCNLSYNMYGINLLESSHGNTIVGTTFLRNLAFAISIEGGSTGNTILSNSFILNGDQSDDPDLPWAPQCTDNNTANVWNSSGSPHGYGNHWYGFDSPTMDGMYDDPVPISVSPTDSSVSTYDRCGYNFAPNTPSAPTGIGVKISVDQAELTWSAPTDVGGSEMSEYIVYRASASTGWVKIADVNGLEYVDQDVTGDTFYLYKVSAVNLMGEGTSTEEVLVFIPGPEDTTLLWITGILILVIIFVTIFALTLWNRE
jgi:hypothetical protein